MSSLVIVIPTYQRASLLRSLLEDITSQTVQPEGIIIVDGDPASGEALAMLKTFQPALQMALHYIASNHGNLAYQRYLGWRAANRLPVDTLLYLDDDLRIPQQDTIGQLLSPLSQDASIAGATGEIHMGVMGEKFLTHQVLADRPANLDGSFWIRKLGSSRKTLPGSVTPSGHRTLPIIDPQAAYASTEWLRGGVMAFRMSALTQECFSVDLFALDHIKCGKGEDTFLSRQVMQKGSLVFVSNAIFEHPNLDTPKTYPITAQRFGYASAYSRRFLNDHYRITEPPHLADRAALLKSYLGNNLLNFARALAHPRRHRWAYAWGYMRGSLRGLLQKPIAKNLTPEIDWWQDAEVALRGQVIITP